MKTFDDVKRWDVSWSLSGLGANSIIIDGDIKNIQPAIEKVKCQYFC